MCTISLLSSDSDMFMSHLFNIWNDSLHLNKDEIKASGGRVVELRHDVYFLCNSFVPISTIPLIYSSSRVSIIGLWSCVLVAAIPPPLLLFFHSNLHLCSSGSTSALRSRSCKNIWKLTPLFVIHFIHYEKWRNSAVRSTALTDFFFTN